MDESHEEDGDQGKDNRSAVLYSATSNAGNIYLFIFPFFFNYTLILIVCHTFGPVLKLID